MKWILHSFYKRTPPLNDSAAVRLKAQFESLLLSSPRESLQGVRDYLGVKEFAEGEVYIHTYTHTYTHTCAHACVHTNALTHTHTYVHQA